MTKYSSAYTYLCMPLFAVILSSCSSYKTTGQCDFSAVSAAMKSPMPALVADIPDSVAPTPLNAVSVSDENILYKVMPRAVTARRTDTDTVQVIASIVNCTDYPLTVEARTQFYDEQEAPIENVTAWDRVMLSPRSTSVYRASSIGTTVASYTVELREGR
jgi:hypothetical protein